MKWNSEDVPKHAKLAQEVFFEEAAEVEDQLEEVSDDELSASHACKIRQRHMSAKFA
jgi:uncharacterized metal-binding protein YceD (DUF177 family)